VEDNLASLRILSKEVGQQHKAAAAAQREVQLSVVRYQNGLDSYVNVITAQNAFLRTGWRSCRSSCARSRRASPW
jgi:outer membrane protein TolC